ncbi:protein phosphatase 2C-like protein [Leptomonas pyrrhocoris]|uniref:Protein phosphatase 2C-like protein n=1 Tax=Leptomonas pyrrhocoris TaxID=157538 RepID=A0A0M9G545_LEPPY|nr:protein phosphatase 2C-like protein [Leptomonas pyrrhocoris]KPA82316.1 protein phosphatase 2C-like protein [Leptomonas pyrrhocoris]|eukprot:XP_015660755.1 protein phosphatase 2C-like protein [Leptomonas pyrrhocoris]
MSGFAAIRALDGPAVCQRRPVLCSNTALYPSKFLKTDSFDLTTEAQHQPGVLGERMPSETYAARTPLHHTSFPTRLLPSHLTSCIFGSSFSPSLTDRRRQWVRDFGAVSDQGIRSTMEDEHIAFVKPDVAFFGVYDGHGGRQCAVYVRDHLHDAVLQHADLKAKPARAISDAFAQVERDFLTLSDDARSSAGCVCAAAVIQGDLLTVGNVGDCEVVLARAGKPVPLTVKHNPSCNAAEATRVTEAGGCIFNNRVGHPSLNPRLCSLAVSRAIGDACFKLDTYTLSKPSGLIADADTCEVHLTPEDAFLIIACDGLWDTMTYEDAVQLCAQHMESGADANTVAEKLVCEALMRGSRDNITVVFVSLGPEAGKSKK